MRIVHQGLVLVLVPLILAVAVIGFIFNCILQTDAARLAERQERRVADNACQALLTIGDLGAVLESFALKGNKLEKQRLKEDIELLKSLRVEAKAMKTGSAQQDFLDGLDQLMQKIFGQLQDTIQALKHGDIAEAMSMLDTQKRSTGMEIFKLSRSISAVNLRATEHLQKLQQSQQQYFELERLALFGGVGFSIVFGLWLARSFMSGIAQRLQVVMDNTIRLSRGQDLNPALSGRDEIATLDRGFHSMAAALRAAMAKERALFESASDVICIFDEKYRITAVNPAFTRILGYDTDMTVGRCFLDLVAPDDVKRTTELLDSTEFGAPSIVFENAIMHHSGGNLDLLWSVYRSKLDLALYAVAHDISERKQVDRAKEEFLSMVSHDLRSPLASIYGTFKLLAASAFGPLPDAIQNKINGILTNVNRLLTLVNDLLDMEKLQSGKMELEIEQTKLPVLIQNVASEVEPLANAKKIKIALDCQCNEFPLDSDRIQQVLVNLLSNSLKYSPSDTVVTLRAYSDGQNLRVEVIDNGRGVPEDQKARIFERFKQARSTDANVGTGLGLPICKMIVEQHGGSIGVDTGKGGGASPGSIFWFTLPAQRPQVDAPVLPNQNKQAAVSTPAPDSARLKKSFDTAGKPKSRGFSFTNLRLMQKAAILLVVPVVFELALAGALYPLLSKAFQEQQLEMQYLLFGRLCNDLMINFSGIATSIGLHNWQDKWPAFVASANDIKKTQAMLNNAVENNPEAKALTQDVHSRMMPVDQFIDQAFYVVAHHGISESTVSAEAFAHRDELIKVCVDALPVAKRAMTAFNDRGNASPETLKRLRDQQGTVLFSGLIVALLISAGSAFVFSMSIARRLRVTEENVHRLERDEPLNAALPGSDELSHLDQYFHSMATALNEARRKERAVFDNSQDVMSAWNQEGMVLRVNPACTQVLGYEPMEMIGRVLEDMVIPEQKAKAEKLLSTAGPDMLPCQFECTMVRKDGTHCELLWSLSWSPQEEAVIAIGHNISERKRLERLKKEFLAMVSHDMRTPLASISMTAEMMNEGAIGQLPDKAKQQLTVVSRSCDRLLLLINDLLDIEKLESGNMQLNVESVSALSIMQRTAEALANLSEQKHLTVAIDVPESVVVNADGGRLVQVAVNLLSNAIKFSDDGTSIRLSAASRPAYVEFAITDSGRGIPEMQLASVFERFKQVEASDGKRAKGTGLGLPIAKQIVEAHGGEIGVSSKVGQGSTFWFRIPTVSSGEPQAPAKMPPGAAR